MLDMGYITLIMMGPLRGKLRASGMFVMLAMEECAKPNMVIEMWQGLQRRRKSHVKYTEQARLMGNGKNWRLIMFSI